MFINVTIIIFFKNSIVKNYSFFTNTFYSIYKFFKSKLQVTYKTYANFSAYSHFGCTISNFYKKIFL